MCIASHTKPKKLHAYAMIHSHSSRRSSVKNRCPSVQISLTDMWWLGQPKFNSQKFSAHFWSSSNIHKPNFALIPWGNTKLLGHKKVNVFLQHSFFSIHQYFIETTTTGIDKLLQVLLQFCNNSGFVAISDVIMLFCPKLDDWILCKISVVRQETWSYSIW